MNLKQSSLLAKDGFDPAENEPYKIWQRISFGKFANTSGYGSAVAGGPGNRDPRVLRDEELRDRHAVLGRRVRRTCQKTLRLGGADRRRGRSLSGYRCQN